MYVGTYTNQGSEGIYLYRFNSDTGVITPIGLAAKADNPSFLDISPNHDFLYSAGEVNNFGGQRAGVISAYSIDRASGKLTLINQVSSKGAGPCYVAVDRRNRVVVAANYGGGSVASYRVMPGGKLSEAVSFIQHQGSSANPQRQREPHAHSINFSPNQRFAVAADLGTDELRVYKVNTNTGELSPGTTTKLAPGAGPRHFTFHPNAKWAYAINELHNTVTALNWDGKKGTLTAFDTAETLPDMKVGGATAEVQVHPSGKWLYGSTRGGFDSIAVFDIDPKTGKLKRTQAAPSGGAIPRNFRIDPTGRWLVAAHQRTGNLVVHRIDPSNGNLSQTGEPVKVASAVCVKFVPIR